ncbi:MAG: YigZ family protein [Coriobacteriaceae bacterium]|nr:YigZ family protein [Coriobacteriaceae bacterium]
MDSYKTIRGRASAEITEKKSRFIAQLAPVQTEEEALAFLEEVRAANRMARHNVYAYILRSGGSGQTERIRFSDDGEPAQTAGMPVLETIQHAGLTDVVAVVTRYFGGVLLGTGGLVRAYTQATQEALAAAEPVEIVRCVDIEITVAYAQHDQLMHLIAQSGGQVLDTVYEDTARVRLRMPDGAQGRLLEAVSELEHGHEDVRVGKPYDAPDPTA